MKKKKISFENNEAEEKNEVVENQEEGIKEPLKELKSEFEELKEEKKEEKQKRTRKKKKIPIDEDFQKSISGIGSSALSIIVERLPNPFPLSDSEKNQFDLVFDKLAEKYVSIIGKYQEETAFVLVLALIILPRTNFFKKKEIEKKESIKDEQ